MHFSLNRHAWIEPALSSSESEFLTRFGLGIQVQVFAEAGNDLAESSDSSNLLQRPGRVVSNSVTSDTCIQPAQKLQRHPCITDSARFRPSFAHFSLSDEFIRYVQAVGSQEVQAEIPPIQPFGMSEQPLWVQDLWEKWVETVETIAQNGGDQQGLRLETWFTNPRRTRCEQSRLVVLSSDFHREREVLSAWHDRAGLSLPTQFAIVLPNTAGCRQNCAGAADY